MQLSDGRGYNAVLLRGTKVSRDGDIIVALEGKPVDLVATLLARLDNYRVDERVRLRIWRGWREMELDVMLQTGI